MVLEKIPEKMVVIGAGAIGVEFAHLYNTFGTKVTLIEAMPHILPNEDEEVSKRLAKLLEPGEVELVSLSKPMLQLRGTAAVLERQKSLKRCRHLLESWAGQRLATLERCIEDLIEQERLHPSESVDMEILIEKMFQELNSDAINFQNLYYSERKHIRHLDDQRCSGYSQSQSKFA